MTLHDWTRVGDGIFHALRVVWTVDLFRFLNNGVLPPDHVAIPERFTPEVANEERPRTIAVREISDCRLVAVIEIVSRGNKSSENGVREFVRKSVEFLEQGVHLLIIDLHPPGPHDPQGLYSTIGQELSGGTPVLPRDGPCTFAAFDANPREAAAYIMTAKVGEPVPTVPLFLAPGRCVDVDLEPSYTSAVLGIHPIFRRPLEQG